MKQNETNKTDKKDEEHAVSCTKKRNKKINKKDRG
jgi:hypothetical protein